MNVTYYLWNESFSSPQGASVEELKNRCRDFSLLMELITDKGQTAKASVNVYSQEIVPGNELADWLYLADVPAADEQALLRLAFEQQIIDIDEVEYASALVSFGSHNQTALIGLFEVRPFAIPDWLCLYTVHHWDQANRYVLENVQHCEEFGEYMPVVFSGVCFSPNVLDGLRTIEPFEKYAEEITRHLSALNDFAKEYFSEESYSKAALDKLQTHGINCSLQGDPEYEARNLMFEFRRTDGSLKLIRCAPHTKLKDHGPRRNYRIYFSWGDAEIEDNTKVLVGHIGRHR